MTTEERFTKIEHAIRDLIVVSRTLVESQKETTTQIRELTAGQRALTDAQRALHDEFDRKTAEWRELSADTEEKLNALIEVVDRIIRRENGQA